MNKLLPIVCVFLVCVGGSALAREPQGYINTIPEAQPASYLFPVRIDQIDGRTPEGTMGGRANIVVKAGKHKILAWMNLKNRWLGNLALPPENEWAMEFELDVQEGVTYILAGKAVPTQAQKPGEPLWEPIVYRAHGKGVNYQYGKDDK